MMMIRGGWFVCCWVSLALVLSCSLSLTTPVRAVEPKQPAVIFFAPHRSGSSFIEKIMNVLTRNLKLCHFGTFPRTGECSKAVFCTGELPPIRKNEINDKCDEWIVGVLQKLRPKSKFEIGGGTTRTVLRSKGFVWGPVRTSTLHSVDENALDIAIDHLVSANFHPVILFHHRHPLDIVVSEYYTYSLSRTAVQLMYTKMEPLEYFGGEFIENITTIDDFALGQTGSEKWWKMRYGDLFHEQDRQHQHGERDDVTIIMSSYGEMVSDFESWVYKIVKGVLPDYDDKVVNVLAMSIYQHYRASFDRVEAKPSGMYKTSLKKSTIAKVEKRHGTYIRKLGYELDYDLRKGNFDDDDNDDTKKSNPADDDKFGAEKLLQRGGLLFDDDDNDDDDIDEMDELSAEGNMRMHRSIDHLLNSSVQKPSSHKRSMQKRYSHSNIYSIESKMFFNEGQIYESRLSADLLEKELNVGPILLKKQKYLGFDSVLYALEEFLCREKCQVLIFPPTTKHFRRKIQHLAKMFKFEICNRGHGRECRSIVSKTRLSSKPSLSTLAEMELLWDLQETSITKRTQEKDLPRGRDKRYTRRNKQSLGQQQHHHYVAENSSPIGNENPGHKMMQRMGWKPGVGLGKHRQGTTEPVSVEIRKRREGLGSKK
eukprot:m.125865 g.125865  ORF g.125865 m.125865 type:complete len:652 (-) comp9433_c6_seq3:251-2206(-)